MAERRIVHIVVVRVKGGWCAEIPHLRARRSARTLQAVDQQIRELIEPDPVEYEFRTGDPVLDRLVVSARLGRLAARLAETEARELTARVIAHATQLTGRDLGVLLELSHQRVQQLRRC